MIELALGILIGATLAILLLVIEIFLEKKSRHRGIANYLQRKVVATEALRPKGYIADALDDDAINRRDKIKKNDEQGIDTKLTDLYDN